MSCAVIQGEAAACMIGLAWLEDRAQLIYMDPPFMTGRAHKLDGALAFDDRWPSLDHFLESLRESAKAAKLLLGEGGCLVVHVDPKTSHYVKVMLDGVFGRAAFASEIVWRYRRWPTKTRNFQRVHDVLLRYVVGGGPPARWEQLYEPLAASTRAVWGTGKQRAVMGADGRRRKRSQTLAAPSPGVPMGDVWDIGVIAPSSAERTGYPTQKPEALLTRLISACTSPGDLVVDPYAGSGTTLAAALKLGRRCIGIDSSPAAIRVMKQRLADYL